MRPATDLTLTKSCGSQWPRNGVHSCGPSTRSAMRHTKTALMLSMARLPSPANSPAWSSATERCFDAARMARTCCSRSTSEPDSSAARSTASRADAVAESASTECGSENWVRAIGCAVRCLPEAAPNRIARRAFCSDLSSLAIPTIVRKTDINVKHSDIANGDAHPLRRHHAGFTVERLPSISVRLPQSISSRGRTFGNAPTHASHRASSRSGRLAPRSICTSRLARSCARSCIALA